MNLPTQNVMYALLGYAVELNTIVVVWLVILSVALSIVRFLCSNTDMKDIYYISGISDWVYDSNSTNLYRSL